MRKNSILFNQRRPAEESKRIRNNAGFSLIELMVVIAIVAILAGSAIPAFISWRGNSQFRGVVTTLKGDLEAAKMRAIRDNNTATFTLNGDGSYTASTGGTAFLTRNPTVGTIAFINGLTSPITFTSEGRLDSTTSNPGDITITGSRVVTINVSRLGRISIQ